MSRLSVGASTEFIYSSIFNYTLLSSTCRIEVNVTGDLFQLLKNWIYGHGPSTEMLSMLIHLRETCYRRNILLTTLVSSDNDYGDYYWIIPDIVNVVNKDYERNRVKFGVEKNWSQDSSSPKFPPIPQDIYCIFFLCHLHIDFLTLTNKISIQINM